MSFSIKCKCGATIPPERLIGLRLDRIPTECDACAPHRQTGERASRQEHQD